VVKGHAAQAISKRSHEKLTEKKPANDAPVWGLRDFKNKGGFMRF
jgi:hypothetical protein